MPNILVKINLDCNSGRKFQFKRPRTDEQIMPQFAPVFFSFFAQEAFFCFESRRRLAGGVYDEV